MSHPVSEKSALVVSAHSARFRLARGRCDSAACPAGLSGPCGLFILWRGAASPPNFGVKAT